MERSSQDAHIMLLSGGAFRGAVQVPVIKKLMKENTYESINGVSIGSINGVLAAMGKLDRLEKFWSDIDGMRPYLHFRWFYVIGWITGILPLWEWVTGRTIMGGLYSMEGLHRVLQQEVHIADMKTPFTAGIVSMNTGKYYTIDSRTVSDDLRLAKSCLISSCMAPLMSPPTMQMEEDTEEEEAGYDGSVRNLFPFPEAEIARLRDEGKRVIIHAIGCTPMSRVSRVPTKDVSRIIDIGIRGVDILEAEVYKTDILQLQTAVGVGGIVCVWVPEVHPGASLDASPEAIQRRLRIGEAMANGPAIVFPGIG